MVLCIVIKTLRVALWRKPKSVDDESCLGKIHISCEECSAYKPLDLLVF